MELTPLLPGMFQIFNSTMVGSSPRESLSSISRVQTVLSLTSQSQDDSERPELDSYSKLQMELQLLQTKLNNVSGTVESLEIFEFCLLFRWRNLELPTRRQTNNCCLSSTNFLPSSQGMSSPQAESVQHNRRRSPAAQEFPPPSGDRRQSGSRRGTP